MTKYIYSWNQYSEGAKALSLAMGIKRIRHNGSRFRGRLNKTVINWGASEVTEQIERCHIINTHHHVSLVSDKLKFFEWVSRDFRDANPRVPNFTTDPIIAGQWLADGKQVCARKVLRGSGGAGLVILNPGDEVIEAPLYVEYKKKRDEYRIHIVNGEVIDVQKKAKRVGFEGDRNTQIRNLQNGYIFAREGVLVPDDVLTQAKLAMAASGLDFGAVDVIWNEREGQAYVLEINSAPGLQGSTIQKYATALGNL